MGIGVRPFPEPRVVFDVASAVRLRRLEHRSQSAVGSWQRPDCVPLFRHHAGRDEFGKMTSVVRHTESGLPGVSQLPGSVHYLLEDRTN